MNKLSINSLKKLENCDTEIIKIVKKSIKTCPVDFGISEGYRSIEKQQLYFKQKKSKCDGINKLSYHNYLPSLAFDFFCYVDGNVNYEERYMNFVAGWICATGKSMDIDLIWGGNWDNDGEIITDQSLIDIPHIQLKK